MFHDAGNGQTGATDGRARPRRFELREVSVERAGRLVLDDVSATLPGGSVAVFGPSGAGKSTLLRLLNRLLEPSRGAVLYEGRNLREIDPLELRRRVALVPQLPALEPATVADNLRLGQRFAAVGRWLRWGRQVGATGADAAGADRDALAKLLASVGLGPEYLARQAERLSVGEQQRVMIARALALDPEVLLLDEPTAALDADSRRQVEQTLTRLRSERGIALVLVSHDRQQVARLCEWVVELDRGKLVAAGSCSEVLGRVCG